jgi:hypothetical protein
MTTSASLHVFAETNNKTVAETVIRATRQSHDLPMINKVNKSSSCYYVALNEVVDCTQLACLVVNQPMWLHQHTTLDGTSPCEEITALAVLLSQTTHTTIYLVALCEFSVANNETIHVSVCSVSTNK